MNPQIVPSDTRQTRGNTIDETRIYNGLTPKQYAYCEARAAGMGQLQSYRFAYPDSEMTDAQVSVKCWEMERDERIVLQARKLILANKAVPSLVPHIDVSKDFVIQGIAGLAVDQSNKSNTRLQAYIALGKVNGVDAFRDIIVHEKRTRTVEEIDAEIARLISAQGGVIDITPNQAPAIEPTASAKDRRRKPIA